MSIPLAVLEPELSRSAPTRTLSICLINPRFEPSYWGFDFALPLYPGNKRSTMISGALPTIAGLSGSHDIRLLDENVEAIDWDQLARFDIVGLTGMNVQKERMKQILLRLRDMPPHVVVGGPYASVKEDYFDGLCDTVFVGESEVTWPEFLAAFAAGEQTAVRYQQADRTDMTTVPIPRYDLLDVGAYASGSVQFSRGCPFQCEFCDIIVIFGRKPRVKEPSMLVAELEAMRVAGFFSAFIVDDNFIGNKKAAKAALEAIIPWQKEHGYPLRLTTEASLNLADEADLLELMYQANFRSVFIGIETPRLASLQETKKFQNTKGDSMAAKLARIQNAGLDIHAGFIVGFDSDDKQIFEDQYQFIQSNGITLAMVGMLTAIPSTPLYARLEKEGRLREDDINCNFLPKQMTQQELKEGYWGLVERLYSPSAFLDRYFKVYGFPEYLDRRARICQVSGEGRTVPTLGYGAILSWNLFRTLLRNGALFSNGWTYLKYFFTRNLRYRRDIVGFAQFVNRCVTHWHFYKFTKLAVTGRLRAYNPG